MTPEDMARLHAAAFAPERGWSVAEITALAAPPGFAVTLQGGFALGRAIAGEAELLTLAVHPDARRRGTGRSLLERFLDAAAAHGAARAFLEVAEDNDAARALYLSAGYRLSGRRKGYYARPQGPPVDALVMTRDLGTAKG